MKEDATSDDVTKKCLVERVEPAFYPDEGQVIEVVVPRTQFADDDGTLDEAFEGGEKDNGDQYNGSDTFDPETGFTIISFALRAEDDTPRLTLLYTVAERDPPGPTTVKYEYIDGQHGQQRVIVPDTETARGMFLQLAETHGIEEAAVIDPLASVSGFDLDAHITWLTARSERERQLRLLDLAESRAGSGQGDAETDLDTDLVNCYLNAGRWRETGLSPDAKAMAREIATELEPVPWLCYRTSVGAIKYLIDKSARAVGATEVNIPTDEDSIYRSEMGAEVSDGDVWPFAENDETLRCNGHRIRYVEGLALPRQAGRVVQHAWIEIDGAVADLTWPWHSPDPIAPDTFDPNSVSDSDSVPTGMAAPGVDGSVDGQGPAVYFGTTLPWPQVIATTERRNGHSPILGDEATMRSSINDAGAEKERRVRNQSV